ncbi:MAG TPA: 23S rRNA (uracil(1939)-C(5))-methyltransferase RlmD, partial [Spirochaetota bacterium]|nr:23S rRNA (uracil(1939)-C(5))-methyltransferase RlmD [Spirochaetota bacterium]
NKDLGAILTIVKKHISRNKIPLYKREKNSGLFRYLICRSSGYEKKHMLIFVLTAYNIDPLLPMLKELIALKNIKSFYINLNRKKTAEISGKKNILIHGDDHLVETVDNYYYRISPDSFFQINTAQTAVLYNEAEKMLPLSRNMILADLYCGTGTLTVRLAKKVKKVYGIEKNSNAVKDAAVNSNLNNAANAEFLNAEAAAGLKELCSYKKKPDAVILNPPRTGCSRSVLNTIIKNEIRYILYISCKPSTQARDLKILTQQNYVLLKCRPLDMFPHTTLVENIILMERK